MAKGKDYRYMIHTARWVTMRKAMLAAHPWCERCLMEGHHTMACEVHHIHPVEDAPTTADRERLMFDIHNLQSLCHDCHVKTHIELGSKGKQGAERRRKAEKEDFKRRFLGKK